MDHGYQARRKSYNARSHRNARARWARRINAGEVVNCWRCGQPITAGMAWHMGHDDHDRTITRGPEHQLCNLSAAGRKATHTRTGTRTHMQAEPHPNRRTP